MRPRARVELPGTRRSRSSEAQLDETIALALAIELEVVGSGIVPLVSVRPATLIGKGKVEEISGLVKSERVDIVI
ncbi:MAG: GTPase HflX, partial [Xanthobacteraceae bacterium]